MLKLQFVWLGHCKTWNPPQLSVLPFYLCDSLEYNAWNHKLQKVLHLIFCEGPFLSQYVNLLCSLNFGLFDLIYFAELWLVISCETTKKGNPTKIRRMCTRHKNLTPFFPSVYSPLFSRFSVQCAILLAQIQNALKIPYTHTDTHSHTSTHTVSLFLWADLTALALSLVELHPANPRRSATGAIPMESQTFQAFVKAGLTSVSSAPYALTLTTAIRFTTAHCCFTAALIGPAGKCFFLSTLKLHAPMFKMLYLFVCSVDFLINKVCKIWESHCHLVMAICCTYTI